MEMSRVYCSNWKQLEESKRKVILAEARTLQMEKEIEKLRGELRDVAAVEASLYSATAEHGSSSLKLHAPERRLARVYSFACKHGIEETRTECARNTMAGLVLVARTQLHIEESIVLQDHVTKTFSSFLILSCSSYKKQLLNDSIIEYQYLDVLCALSYYSLNWCSCLYNFIEIKISKHVSLHTVLNFYLRPMVS